jgi:hypothetical protein
METQLSKYNIIIIGSGIAAQTFLKGISDKYKILVIDGGDKQETENNQQLTINNEYGHFSDNHWGSHWRRVYGGNSRIWGGYLGPLDESDFQGHLNIPEWPIKYTDLLEDYKKAAIFHGRNIQIVTDYPKASTDNNILYRPISVTKFSETSRPISFYDPDKELNRKNVDIWLNTNVIRFVSSTRKIINGIWVSDSEGIETLLDVNPNQKVIMACGGLGNAQLLLQPSPDGGVPIGNESGMVGKFLMEHVHAVVSSNMLIDENLTKNINNTFGSYEAGFILPKEIRLKESLLHSIILIPNVRINTKRENVDQFQEYFEKKFNKRLYRASAIAMSEQEPLAINAVNIINEKNWAGLYKLRTQCAFSARDLWSIDQTTRYFGEYLRQNKLGVLRIDNDGIYRKLTGGGHTMGTTRMGFSIRDSVVDKNCKVHSYDNLYILGSSVFPSGGAVNPTLTISALAFRLASHLS